jgi:hypothetical protein
MSWWKRALGLDPQAVPPHVFALDGERLRYGQFLRQGTLVRFRGYRSVALPNDVFLAGPLGGPPRDAKGFGERVAALVADAATASGTRGGIKEASLILPDGWLRVTFTESTELPRAAEAADEVLRWKLKRLVPFRVEELRVDATEVTPLPNQAEPRRLLLGFGSEVLLAQIEDAFSAAGVRLGLITSASLALVAALALARENESGSGFHALVAVEAGGYTLVFARGGEPVLHRYKAFATALPEDARAGMVERDLKLTRNFLDEHYGGAALDRVVLSAPPEVEPLWLDLLAEGLSCPALALDGRILPPLRAEETTAPWRDLAPMLGAARLEVA